MYQDNVVLCGANSYEEKYYFNEDFSALPEAIKKELKIMCVLFVSEVGGILLLHFYFDVGINTAITLCMPVIGIIGLCGFYQKNGLTLAQLVRRNIKLIFQKPYVYETRNQ